MSSFSSSSFFFEQGGGEGDAHSADNNEDISFRKSSVAVLEEEDDDDDDVFDDSNHNLFGRLTDLNNLEETSMDNLFSTRTGHEESEMIIPSNNNSNNNYNDHPQEHQLKLQQQQQQRLHEIHPNSPIPTPRIDQAIDNTLGLQKDTQHDEISPTLKKKEETRDMQQIIMPPPPPSSSVMTSREGTDSVSDSSILRRDNILDKAIPMHVKERDMDIILAQELNQMSLKEREQTYEQIHGVDQRNHFQETSELLQQSLEAFPIILQRDVLSPLLSTDLNTDSTTIEVRHAKYQAYQLALSKNASYVTSRKLRLMFLRCANFNVLDAAQNCVEYFYGKLQLFGPDVFCRAIQLSDLSKADMACLKSGAYQLLPSRDTAGRAIIVDFHLVMPQKCYTHPENLLRTVAYLQLTAAEDEETQRHGLIGISYYVGELNQQFNHSLNKELAEISKWFPLRLNALHMCYHAPELRTWKPLAMWLMGKDMRVRVRVHDGSQSENRYSLMTFGIPIDQLPLTYQGDLKTIQHMKWLNRRRKYENHQTLKRSSSSASGSGSGSGSGHDSSGQDVARSTSMLIIDLPGRNDVLLRRGRVFQEHFGNLQLRNAMDESLLEFSQASTKEKANIVSRIIADLEKQFGARYLEMAEEGWWVLVEPQEAIRRIMKSMRALRRKVDSNTTAATTTTSTVTDAETTKNINAVTAGAASTTTSTSETSTTTTSLNSQTDEMIHRQKRMRSTGFKR